MKKTKKLNFLEWNNHVLINSFKRIDLSIFLIVFLDALFYAISGLIVFFWFQRVMAKIFSFQVPTDLISLGYDKAQGLVKEIRLFYILIIASFILVLLAIIFLASILKGIIWAKTTKTKLTFALISKFLVLNLIWMGFWFVFILLLSMLLEPSISAVIIGASIVISLYLSSTLYALFMKEQKINAIFKAIKLNTTKIHMFLLPYFMIVLVISLFLILGARFSFNYSQVIITLIMIIIAALVRYYHSGIVSEIGSQK